MEAKKTRLQVIKKRIGKTVFWFFTVIAGLLLLSLILVNTPWVQTRIAKAAAGWLSEKIDFRVEMHKIQINWLDHINIDSLQVYDRDDSLMIDIPSLALDFNYKLLYDPDNPTLDFISIDEGTLNLLRDGESGYFNLSIFIFEIQELTKKENSKPPRFAIGRMATRDFTFRMNDQKKDSIVEGFDYKHFEIQHIQTNISNFNLLSDTVQMQVERLQCADKATSLKVKNLTSFFRLSKNSIEFYGLDLKTGKSHISDTLVLRYSKIANLSYFVDSVDIYAHLNESEIHLNDLAYFAPQLGEYKDGFRVNGVIDGAVSNLRVEDLQLWLDEGSYFSGDLYFNGLPRIDETFLDLKLRNASLRMRDLRPYLTEEQFDAALRVGDIRCSANFIGFINDFVAEGSFTTDFGKVKSDLNLKLEGPRGLPTYVGNMTLTKFDLGKLAEAPDMVQKINMKGRIEGEGFELETARLFLDATFRESTFNNYTFDSLWVRGNLAKELFEGELAVKDPNLKIAGKGKLNLAPGKEKVRFVASLDTALVENLGWSDKLLHLRSTLDLDFTGLDPDDITGRIKLSKNAIAYEDRSMTIDSVHITAEKDDSIRTVSWQSDRLSASLTGDYTFKSLGDNLSRLVREYEINFANQEEEINEYYAEEREEPESFEARYAVRLGDINPFLNLVAPGLSVSRGSQLSGYYRSGYTSIVTLQGQVDTLNYDDNILHDLEVDVHSSKIADSTNVLASAYLYSAHQELGNANATNNLLFEGIWDRKLIQFIMQVEDTTTQSNIDMEGQIAFLTNETELSITRSDILALGQPWLISDSNKVIFRPDEIEIDSLRLSHNNEQVAINGIISTDSTKVLRVDLQHFQLENIEVLVDFDIQGNAGGYARLQNLYGTPTVEMDLDIEGFSFNNVLLGRLDASSQWDKASEAFDVNVSLQRKGAEVMVIEGGIYPRSEENQLDLTAEFKKADISVAQSFLDEFVTGLSGTASGKFAISGTLGYPILRGDGYLNEGFLTINYLNTSYTFEGPINFEDNEIGVKNMRMYDINRNLAKVDGGLFHDGFRNFVIDLTGDLTNFQVLNTTSKDNSLFYGTAYATGSINFLGALSNLNITARATTAKDTRIYLPMQASSSAAQKDFIHFTDLKNQQDTLATDSVETVNLKGLNLDFDLDITPDAYAEIIFDIRTGDIIRGRGSGDIKMQIDTKGEFNLFGKYVFESGGYNFTFGNIINKEFAINPKSEINWYGDPYAGVMDIQADYRQFTSMAPILSNDEAVQNHPDVRRRYPVNVILELDGELLQPSIDFEIEVKDFPDNVILSNGTSYSLRLDYAAFQNKLATDEQELKRQAFSLIVLKKFVPINSFQVAGGNSLGNSVSEFVSNQLSYWVTQFDENLEVDVDLAMMDDEEYNTFQLRLSYTFLDGRLRITRDGGFNNQATNQADISSIAGDWTVEYLLTPDGRLKVKMYNRNNANQVNSSSPDESLSTGQVTGVSLSYTRSFDEIKNLLDFSRDKNKQKRQREQPIPGGAPLPSQELDSTKSAPADSTSAPTDSTKVEGGR